MVEHWRLKHFYHTIINAQIVGDRRNAVWPDGSGASFALIPNPKGRGVLMILPSDPDGPMLDLIEWLEPKADFPVLAPTKIPRVIAFRTENVREAHRALKAKGVTFTTEEPTSIPAAGITGCIVACDPNGNLIEMI